MTWIAFSFREWQRRPLRTAITAAGVAIAVAALYSLLSFESGYREGLRRELEGLGAHVLVVPKGCPYDAASIALHGASWPCYLKGPYLDEVRATPGVATAAPAFMTAVHDLAGHQTVYVGIDAEMLKLKRQWQFTGRFPSKPGELLAGSDAATRFGWQIGQTVSLPGIRDANGRVTGILSPMHGADDAFVYMPLADAQALVRRPGHLTHILVRLADPNNLDTVVRQLRGCNAGMDMNVVPLAHLFRTIQSVVSSTRLLLAGLAVVALLAAGAGISNALLMAVAERTREIGVMRALGASRLQIFQLFWLQTLHVCLTGAVVGLATAFFASRGVEAWLRSQLPFTPVQSLIQWQGMIAVGCLAGALLTGSLAGFLPAWRAGLLPPGDAMRRRDSL